MLSDRVFQNLQTQLTAPQVVLTGATLDYTVYSKTAGSPVIQLAAVLLSPFRTDTPFPGVGTLRIDPNASLTLPVLTLGGPNQSATGSLGIPNAPVLNGLDVFLQSFVIDVPGGLRLTNATRVTLID